MGEKIITLSGAAMDVLYALFYRGALPFGELPSKSGATELRELGLAEIRHTATQFQKENHFTFLTAEGQEFAIKHMVDTRFGEPVTRLEYFCPLAIEDLQKVLDEIDGRIHDSGAFKLLNEAFVVDGDFTIDEVRDALECIKRCRLAKKLQKSMEDISPYVVTNGQVFIKDAFIQKEPDWLKVYGVKSDKSTHPKEINVLDANGAIRVRIGKISGIKTFNSSQICRVFRIGNPIVSSVYNVKVNVKNGELSAAGESIDPLNVQTKSVLSDEMKRAIIDAVRESDLFTAIQIGLKQVVSEAIKDAIRNVLKPRADI